MQHHAHESEVCDIMPRHAVAGLRTSGRTRVNTRMLPFNVIETLNQWRQSAAASVYFCMARVAFARRFEVCQEAIGKKNRCERVQCVLHLDARTHHRQCFGLQHLDLLTVLCLSAPQLVRHD